MKSSCFAIRLLACLLRYSAFLVVNLERSSGTFSGNCSADPSDFIIHYASARYSVGCARSGLICWKPWGVVTGGSDPWTILLANFREILCQLTLAALE